MIFELFKKMYSRNLFTICISGYFFLELLLISRRTHRVRTAKSSLFNKNISLKFKYKRFREYISFIMIHLNTNGNILCYINIYTLYHTPFFTFFKAEITKGIPQSFFSHLTLFFSNTIIFLISQSLSCTVMVTNHYSKILQGD